MTPGSTVIIAAGFLITFLGTLDTIGPLIMMPQMTAQLGGLHHLPWVLPGYYMASTIAMPIFGRLCDLHGVRRLMLVAMSLFLAGALCCAAAQDMPQLIAARILQGFGSGGLLTLAPTMLGLVVSGEARAKVMSRMTGVQALAYFGGPILAAAVSGWLSWRLVFLLNLPLGALAAWWVARHLQASGAGQPTEAFDLRGALLFASGMSLFLFAVTSWPLGDRSAMVAGALVASLLLLGALIWHLRRAAAPLIPLSRPQTLMLPLMLAVLFLASAADASGDLVPTLAQGMDPAGGLALTSGLVMVFAAGYFLGAPVAGWLLTGPASRLASVLGAALMGAWGLAVITFPWMRPAWIFFGAVFLFGAAHALIRTASLVFIQAHAPASAMGVWTSLHQLSQRLGNVLASGVLAAVQIAGLQAYLRAHPLAGADGRIQPVDAEVLFKQAAAGLSLAQQEVVRQGLAEATRPAMLMAVICAVSACALALVVRRPAEPAPAPAAAALSEAS